MHLATLSTPCYTTTVLTRGH